MVWRDWDMAWKGIWNEGILLLIPLVIGQQAVDEFRVKLGFGRHFVHKGNNAAELPAGLQENFGIFGAPWSGE